MRETDRPKRRIKIKLTDKKKIYTEKKDNRKNKAREFIKYKMYYKK